MSNRKPASLEFTKGLYKWVENQKGNHHIRFLKGYSINSSFGAIVRPLPMGNEFSYKVRFPDWFVPFPESEGEAKTLPEAQQRVDEVLNHLLNEEYDFE